MIRFFLTGGVGFIGSALSEGLKKLFECKSEYFRNKFLILQTKLKVTKKMTSIKNLH